MNLKKSKFELWTIDNKFLCKIMLIVKYKNEIYAYLTFDASNVQSMTDLYDSDTMIMLRKKKYTKIDDYNNLDEVIDVLKTLYPEDFI